MAKYEKAVEALTEALVEVGGRLYSVELAKKQGGNSAAIMEMFGSMIGGDDQKNFTELVEAINLLTKAGKE